MADGRESPLPAIAAATSSRCAASARRPSSTTGSRRALATSRFLRGIAERKILGERCPVCGKVYVPPRGACPTDGVPTDRAGRAGPHRHGHVVLRRERAVLRPGHGDPLRRARYILLDGVRPVDHAPHPGGPADEVRIGMRVEAVWVPDDELGPDARDRSSGSGRPASPTPTCSIPGEDARHRPRLLGRRPAPTEGDAIVRRGGLMRDVAVVSFAQSDHERGRRRPQRGRDAHAGHRTRCSAAVDMTSTTSASPARAPPTTSPARRSPS